MRLLLHQPYVLDKASCCLTPIATPLLISITDTESAEHDCLHLLHSMMPCIWCFATKPSLFNELAARLQCPNSLRLVTCIPATAINCGDFALLDMSYCQVNELFLGLGALAQSCSAASKHFMKLFMVA